MGDEVGRAVEAKVQKLASRGIRALGVASCDPNEKYRFIGLLTFLDPPRPDTKETIERAALLGVEVKMITGDHRAIAKETCVQLGMGSNIQGAEDLPTLSIEEMMNPKPGGRVLTLGVKHGEEYENSDGFAQVLPEHKYMIVEALRQRGHLVGMTGDGVNDAPALKRADVGIAVSGSTAAAQAASDIVLTREGLSTIITAIMTSRKIFQRMKNFVIYRVACTEQLLSFFFFSCIFIYPLEYNAEMFSSSYFSIPVLALVSITILNDGTIVSVAHDNVQANQSPEKQNFDGLYVSATAIGGTALVSSLLLLHFGLLSNDAGSLRASMGLSGLTFAQVNDKADPFIFNRELGDPGDHEIRAPILAAAVAIARRRNLVLSGRVREQDSAG